MRHYDYLIVGAGLCGSVLAHELSKKYKVLVIDKRPHIGGNVYTEQKNDIHIHKYGAHIFHTNNKYVWEYVNSFVEFNSFINSPIAIYKDKVYSLPFNMYTFNQMWNVKTPEEAQKIIDAQRLRIRPTNLEEQAMCLVGRDVYMKLIKDYTEKQWGRPCNQLPPSIIKRLPIRLTYNNNYFDSAFQGIPILGYTFLIKKLLSNVDVEINVNFNEIKSYFLSIADKVIYTGSIDEFYDYDFGYLEYRSLEFDTKFLPDTDNYQGNAVVNYTDKDHPWTRIIEHKHFMPNNSAKGTYITFEYPKKCNKGDDQYYPINDKRNNELYAKYLSRSKKNTNVIFAGRLGEYKYYDMDKVIESALTLAKRLST